MTITVAASVNTFFSPVVQSELESQLTNKQRIAVLATRLTRLLVLQRPDLSSEAEDFHGSKTKRSKTIQQKVSRRRRPEMPPSQQQRPVQTANPFFVAMNPNHSNLVG
ncbi:hypothetical protein P9112_002530 [Eukaryota sp. TZLM1-RC]